MKARELKFTENVHPQQQVTCHVSHVMCHMSHDMTILVKRMWWPFENYDMHSRSLPSLLICSKYAILYCVNHIQKSIHVILITRVALSGGQNCLPPQGFPAVAFFFQKLFFYKTNLDNYHFDALQTMANFCFLHILEYFNGMADQPPQGVHNSHPV